MTWRYKIRPEMQDMDDLFAVAQVQKRALARMEGGSKVYGTFDPETDRRDLCREIEDELLDCMNYAAMLVIKIRRLASRIEFK